MKSQKTTQKDQIEVSISKKKSSAPASLPEILEVRGEHKFDICITQGFGGFIVVVVNNIRSGANILQTGTGIIGSDLNEIVKKALRERLIKYPVYKENRSKIAEKLAENIVDHYHS